MLASELLTILHCIFSQNPYPAQGYSLKVLLGMCILFIAVDQHPDYPLIIAANRDEFHNRATTFGHWWNTAPQILAGRDDVALGSWMGISRSGRLSALTNIRNPSKQRDDAKSRGELVVNYLTAAVNDQQYQQQLSASRENYNGYNLLFGDWRNLQVYNNHLNQFVQLKPGVHGLSNASLNSPWPKTMKGMQALSEYCQHNTAIQTGDLFQILRDDVKAADEFLPNTGVPYHWEKLISSTFIVTPEYGTRTSTILLINNNAEVCWQERNFDSTGTIVDEQSFAFVVN